MPIVKFAVQWPHNCHCDTLCLDSEIYVAMIKSYLAIQTKSEHLNILIFEKVLLNIWIGILMIKLHKFLFENNK